MKKIVVLLLLCFSFSFAKGKIAVAISPLAYAVEKIILGKMNITTLLNENYFKDKPSRRLLRSISGMSVYFTLNLPREQEYIIKLKQMNKYLNIVDLTKDFDLISKDGKINPYTWLDPVLYRKMIIRMYKNIILIDSENEEYYTKNADNLLAEIDEVFFEMKNMIYSTTEENFFVYDEYWDYYARRYNLNLFKEKRKIITASEIPPLIKFAKKNSIKKILVLDSDIMVYSSSLANKTNTQIIKHNPFGKNWESNLFVLTKELIKE